MSAFSVQRCPSSSSGAAYANVPGGLYLWAQKVNSPSHCACLSAGNPIEPSYPCIIIPHNHSQAAIRQPASRFALHRSYRDGTLDHINNAHCDLNLHLITLSPHYSREDSVQLGRFPHGLVCDNFKRL